MTQVILIGADIAAILLLTVVMYLPRHRRRDLAVAYLGVNVGVLAVTLILANSAVSAGLGLGLFGVLSIIRLRSDELAQHEVAYYFAALVLGLLGGIPASNIWLNVGGMVLVLVVIGFADHPKFLESYRHQVVVLDTAVASESELKIHMEQLLNASVHSVKSQRLDLVNDTTVVDVRYRVVR